MLISFEFSYNHTQLWQQLHRCNRNLIAFQKKKRASMRGNQIPKLGDDVVRSAPRLGSFQDVSVVFVWVFLPNTSGAFVF